MRPYYTTEIEPEKFEIRCKNCQSLNVIIGIDYGYDDLNSDITFECLDCKTLEVYEDQLNYFCRIKNICCNLC